MYTPAHASHGRYLRKSSKKEWKKISDDCRSNCEYSHKFPGAWGQPVTQYRVDRDCWDDCVDEFRD